MLTQIEKLQALAMFRAAARHENCNNEEWTSDVAAVVRGDDEATIGLRKLARMYRQILDAVDFAEVN